MSKDKKVKAIQTTLNLVMLKDDLIKIQKCKNPYKSKVFRQYADMLLKVLKNVNISDIIAKDKIVSENISRD